MFVIPRVPLVRWLFGYRRFENRIELDDGSVWIQWCWIKPIAASELKLYQPGERWTDERKVVDCNWRRL